jgi:gliding motility-associated-like protein
MRSVCKLIVLIVWCSNAFGQKISYTVNNGVHIAGVDGTNPVIYDNDMINETPDPFFLWLKANKGQIRLVGNISTRDMYNQPNYTFTHDHTFKDWVDLYNRAQDSGLKNIPAPIKGTSIALVKPASGVIEQTQWTSSPGSDLIIAEAHKATPEKPLVIFVGGNVSSVANAYLKDNSIANKVIVFHIDGYRYNVRRYNTTDFWSSYVVMKRFRYVNWSGNPYGMYSEHKPILGIDLTGMPNNRFTEIIRYWYNSGYYAVYKEIGDAPITLWYFNNAVWRNVQRKLENDQTTTSNTFDYLLVSDNDFGAYGPMLSAVLRDPNSYTSTPSNNPPTVNLTAPANNANFAAGSNITLSATASDADGSIARVEFFYGTTKIGEDLSSPYSFAWNNVPAGSYTLTARATDNQAATRTSSAVTITVTAPNSPPSVAVTAPANNASFAAGASVTLSANASDTNGSVAKVEFFNGATKLGEDATSPYSFVWASVPAGTFTITARATDNQNATTTSSAVMLNVAANTPPAVTLTAPANNTSVAAGSSITFSANASDSDGSITKVEFYSGATKLGEDASSPYSFTWPSVPAGTYSLTAKATDNQNAVTTSSASTITAIAANVPPTVTLSAPANNASFAAGVSITITAIASDNDGSIAKVEFYNGTTKLGEDTSSPYSFIWTSVPAGTYSLTAKATDNQNAVNTSAAATTTVIANNVPPTVALTAPGNNASFVAGTSITITASASDNGGSITKVEFYNGATKLGEDASSPYSFTWPSVPAGTYSITAKATDNQNAMNTTSASTITVTANNVPPIVALSAPANNALIVAGSSITLTATTSDSDGTISKVEFFNGATKLGEDATTPYSFVWNSVVAGNYELTAKATDNKNATTVSNKVNISVKAANAIPTVAITSPSNHSIFPTGTAVTFVVSASDGNGSVTKVEFYNGAVKLGEDLTSPYDFAWNNIPVGSYAITAKATDNDNAVTTSQPVTITIKNTLNPTANAGDDVFLTLPENSATLNGSGSSSDGSALTFLWSQVSGPSTIVIEDNASQTIDLNNLVEGTYTLELSVSDEKGLTGIDHIIITVATDLIAQSAIPRYFTPNGDGVNDFWEWPQTELFEKSILMVFDKFGQKVYETINYNNTWDGKVDGKPLGEDAYYYVIRLYTGDDIRGAVRIVL